MLVVVKAEPVDAVLARSLSRPLSFPTTPLPPCFLPRGRTTYSNVTPSIRFAADKVQISQSVHEVLDVISHDTLIKCV